MTLSGWITLAVIIIVIAALNKEKISDFFEDLGDFFKKLQSASKSPKKPSFEDAMRREFRDSYKKVIESIDRHPKTNAENRFVLRYGAIQSAFKANVIDDPDFKNLCKLMAPGVLEKIANEERKAAIAKYCGLHNDVDESKLFLDLITLGRNLTDSEPKRRIAHLIVLGASWCPHSVKFKSNLDKNGIQGYTYIDVDKDSSLLIKYGINEIPTTILIDNHGDIIRKWVGAEEDGSDIQEITSIISSNEYTIIPYKK